MASTDEKLLQAWQSHQRGQVEAAKQVYTSVLQREPNHQNAWCYLGIALHDQRRYAEAVELMREGLTRPAIAADRRLGARIVSRTGTAPKPRSRLIPLTR